MSLFPFGVPFTNVPHECAQTPRFPSQTTIGSWPHHLPAGCGDQDLLCTTQVSDDPQQESSTIDTWLRWLQPFNCKILWWSR